MCIRDSLTGNYLDAATAADWGLVNRVVPHDSLMSTVRAIAQDICSNDQEGVRQMVSTYERTSGTTVDDGWRIETSMGKEWLQRTGFTPEKVAERRAAIQDRGRAQND